MLFGPSLIIPLLIPYTATSSWVNVDKGILQAQLESVPIGFLLDYLKPIQLMGFYLKYPKPIPLTCLYLKILNQLSKLVLNWITPNQHLASL